MDTDLDTLATALYVTTDDFLRAHPERVPVRPRVGFAPRISDAELLAFWHSPAFSDFLTLTHHERVRAHGPCDPLEGRPDQLRGSAMTTP